MPQKRDPKTNPKAFLGKRLRVGRIAAGFSSQDALAAQLGFDRTVIAKAETGERPPTPDVLAAWCEACALDAELFADLAELARSSDGPVPTWFESWLEAEAEAYVLRYWSPIIVTPIFQTAAYARALLLAAQTDTSDEAINALVEAKLERATILDRADPPEVVALIDELGAVPAHRVARSHARTTTLRRRANRTSVRMRSDRAYRRWRDGWAVR
jgi:transcriptional regulator with XRE-family HTH domain